MKLSCMYHNITLDIAGGSIFKAAQDAINIAINAKCAVHFTFNGVKLTVAHFTTIEEVVEIYNNASR